MTEHAGALTLRRHAFLLADVQGFASDERIAGKHFATQLLNAYRLLVPGGEHLVIRACRLLIDAATAEPSTELSGWFFQDGSHARAHKRLLNAMQSMGLACDWFRRAVDWIFSRVLAPLSSARFRPATGAGIEHRNIAIAAHFLHQDLLHGVQESECAGFSRGISATKPN